MFKNPFSFEGRIRRTEYCLSYFIYTVAFWIAYMAIVYTTSVYLYILFVPIIWFLIAQGTKRCHDRGNNGAWQLIPFYALWMCFADGYPETNEYGPDPKGRGDLLEALLKEPAGT